MELKQLVNYTRQLLQVERFVDYCPNGLQVEGKPNVNKIVTGVSASMDLLQAAKQAGADAVLVHHGYFWRGEEAVITGMKRRRIGQLLTHDLNLYAYHLPLDCHADLGNNACLGQLFALQNIQTHPVGNTPALLWSGQLAHPMSACAFSDDLSKKLQREPLCISGTEKPIQRVAWCSGGAQDYIVDAHRLGVDAYISGEISERTYYQAQELGLHYFACGHHATERLGIQALGEHLTARFDVQHRFIDSDNPV